ncbi:MAG TPA: tripartite tricarboxylate transporter substrate binding protein [Advenella sp.]|nr:tripartite tricarboxylate transporter substrate binding protein [Advenella sp.]
MRRLLQSSAFLALCLSNISFAQNQNTANYPDKAITVVIPYSAGGGTDQFLRIVCAQASKTLGQPILILNKPGASTSIGVKSVINAKPDGYTFLVSTNTSYTLIPYAISPAPYSPTASLDYVATLGETAMVLTASASMPSTLKEVLSEAKKSPDKYTYATYGVGTSTHLAGEVLMGDTGVRLRHVPYKGVEAVTALAGGQVDLMVDGVNAAGPMIEAGKTKALVVLQHERSAFLPDTPTLDEAGFSSATPSKISYIMAAPKGTPAGHIDKIQNVFASALRDPGVIRQIEAMRSSPAFLGPEATKNFVKEQAAAFKKIVDEKNISF